ncbi:hypothetical protein GH714_021046 [Hevea brasiliensis]|uniref:Pectate lyase n=1 Tax=Hevea brasiliensis TaxID=3981 RepID=A0A6A6LRJ6_HEVBR|nr:hypothetical protein GH714_021046 [Hevea brasiliensis]
MRSLKLFFLLVLLAAFAAIALSTTPSEEESFVDDNDDATEETSDIPWQESKETKSSLRGTMRFLAQKTRASVMTCDKYPRVCRAKGSPGPDCCKKKCVNVRTDKLNCGKCGKKCKYPEICCKGDYNSQPLSSYLPSNTQSVLNTVDSCWRTESNWASNRQASADCAVGFGQAALGGKYGDIYLVTTPDDNPINPEPGTLRYGVIQTEPLWIIFDKDMVITLKNELIMNSFKTIDGRGAKVEIANGPCLTIEGVSHVIVHGISIHDCKPGKPGLVRSTPTHVGKRQGSDGDAIAVFASSNIWIDHCYLASCSNGLIDVIHASTAVTISNNYFSQHDKVMLLGHNDEYTADKVMKVTVVFNHFGTGLVQRLPSADPTIFSEGNYFIAPDDAYAKEKVRYGYHLSIQSISVQHSSSSTPRPTPNSQSTSTPSIPLFCSINTANSTSKSRLLTTYPIKLRPLFLVRAVEDDDEWGPDEDGSGSASTVGLVEEDKPKELTEIDRLKKQLVDLFYGTNRGLSASSETRAEIVELITQLEAKNPTPAPTEALALLNGKWILG